VSFPGLEIGPLFDGPTRPRPGQELLLLARPDFYSIRAEPGPPSPSGQFPRPARPGPVQGGTIISNLFYKKDFHTMELNDYFSNLSEHCERFIMMVIISWITSDNFNACKNSMRDKSNYLLNRKSKPYSLLLELHEDCHLFTRTS